MSQRLWSEVIEGEALSPLQVPLTLYRLVMAAGANRDFNSIHHNSEFARASGAPEAYANTYFLQGLWERCVRGYIGAAGGIHGLHDFRMHSFSTVGQTLTVEGRVLRKWMDAGTGMAEIELSTRTPIAITVGPGRMLVSLPLQHNP
jgi:acyl dehydratase